MFQTLASSGAPRGRGDISPAPSAMAVPVDVSVVMPIHNANEWLKEALQSVLRQTFTGSLELSVFDDASTDSSVDIVQAARGIVVTLGCGHYATPKGVGYARNEAIKQSSGKHLCIFDADDIMLPDRVHLQHQLACKHGDALIGAQFRRTPEGSTDRYTRWCNSLSPTQLYTQAYTSFGPTIIQPTWFLSRALYDRFGPFDEHGKGTPEDLIFFYKLVSAGVTLTRVDEVLLVYRYHEQNTTFTIEEETIWRFRVEAIQKQVLSRWSHFTIWNAGKQGRRLYRALSTTMQNKVVAFCDVDLKKLAKKFYTYEESETIVKPRVPIVHYTEAQPPFILCVKWDLTSGEFEKNLASLKLVEGQDYYNFS